MTEDEREERRLERLAEAGRVRAAVIGAVLAAFVAALLAGKLACLKGEAPSAILQPLLALTLSLSLTLGARAVDGPIRLAGRRREAISTSAGAAVLLLWLGCFSAIQAAFLVVDVVGRWHPGASSCPAAANSQLRGTLTLVDGAVTRTVALTGCEVVRAKDNEAASGTQNEQAHVDLGSSQAEEAD